MFQELSEKAKTLTHKMDLKQAVEQLKQTAREQVSLTKQRTSELGEKAKELTDKVDLKQTADNLMHVTGDLKQATFEQVALTKQHTNDFLENNWPKIEATMMNGLLDLTEENLKDEKILEALFNKMYEFLPLTVRLFLPRKLFLNYAIQRRTPLLLKVQDYKAKREHPEAPPPTDAI